MGKQTNKKCANKLEKNLTVSRKGTIIEEQRQNLNMGMQPCIRRKIDNKVSKYLWLKIEGT